MREDIFHEQQDKAFRLLEALSDIDEELLVRSEQARSKAAVGVTVRNKTIPIWKYGSVVVACFVLLVLGTGAYGFGKLVFGKAGSAGPVDLASIEEIIKNTENVDSADAVAFQQHLETNSGEEEIEESKREMWAETSDEVQETLTSIQDMESARLESSGSAADLTFEAAKRLAVVGAYVPVTMPEGYQFSSAVFWAAHSLNLIYTNAEKETHIELTITDYYLSTDENVIPADEVTEETFQAESNVAVLYDGGVIVRFGGVADPETFYQVFTSIRP